MATFTEIKDQVIALTGRPDLEAVIKYKIFDVTQRLHLMQAWPRDHIEQFITFGSAANEQSLALNLLTRWRAFSYIRFWDSTAINPMTQQATGWFGARFTEIPPDQIFDSYSAVKDNSFYFSGGAIFLRSWTQISTIVVGYYPQPILIEGSYGSWISTDYSLAIISGVCAEVFASVGDQEQAKNYSSIHGAQVNILQINNNELTVR